MKKPFYDERVKKLRTIARARPAPKRHGHMRLKFLPEVGMASGSDELVVSAEEYLRGCTRGKELGGNVKGRDDVGHSGNAR